MPFSLDKAVAGKRDAETLNTQQSQTNKVPKLSEMKVEPPRQQTARITTNAPVNVVVYKARRKQSEATNFVLFLKPFEVTDNAGDLWSSYREGPPSKLWQIQVSVQKLVVGKTFSLKCFNEFFLWSIPPLIFSSVKE